MPEFRMGPAMSLAELTAMLRGGGAPAGPRPIVEAQIMELRAFENLYRRARAENPLKVGQVVKIRETAPVACDKDQPFICLEVTKEAPDFATNAARQTVRVAHLEDGAFCCHWIEPWMAEPWPQETKPGE